MKFTRTAGCPRVHYKRNSVIIKELNTRPIMKFIDSYTRTIELIPPDSHFKFFIAIKWAKTFVETVQTPACKRP